MGIETLAIAAIATSAIGAGVSAFGQIRAGQASAAQAQAQAQAQALPLRLVLQVLGQLRVQQHLPLPASPPPILL